MGFEGMINKQLLHDKIRLILSQIRNVGNRKVPPCGRDKFISAVDLSTDLKYFSKQILIKKAEYEQALKDEQRYRANKNQASGFAQQRHWIQMLGEQNKVIEEKKRNSRNWKVSPEKALERFRSENLVVAEVGVAFHKFIQRSQCADIAVLQYREQANQKLRRQEGIPQG